MNQTQVINELNKGTVFYGTVPQMNIEYSFNDEEDTYRIEVGANMIELPKNSMVYFYKNPKNGNYVMTYMREDIEIILFYHKNIDEMIDFDELDFDTVHQTNIISIPNKKISIDAHDESLFEEMFLAKKFGVE